MQSTDASSEMIEMLESSDKYFKRTIINMFHDIKINTLEMER